MRTRRSAVLKSKLRGPFVTDRLVSGSLISLMPYHMPRLRTADNMSKTAMIQIHQFHRSGVRCGIGHDLGGNNIFKPIHLSLAMAIASLSMALLFTKSPRFLQAVINLDITLAGFSSRHALSSLVHKFLHPMETWQLACSQITVLAPG